MNTDVRLIMFDIFSDLSSGFRAELHDINCRLAALIVGVRADEMSNTCWHAIYLRTKNTS